MPATFQKQLASRLNIAALRHVPQGTEIGPTEFFRLLISRRRLVRHDPHEEGIRGLCDLDSGELFYTDARRLIDACR